MIDKKEFLQRIKRAKEIIHQENVDALLIPLGVNFKYLFRSGAERTERLTLGIIPADGEAFLITPHFEVERMEHETIFDEIHPWKEHENPYSLTARIIRRVVGRGKIAIDPSMWIGTYFKIKKELDGNFSFTSAEEILKKLRSIKSPLELELIKKAMEITNKWQIKAFEKLEEGVTEREVATWLQQKLTSESSEPAWALVQFQENSAIPHAYPSDKKLQKNDVVLIDCGTSFEGYQGDITMTTVFGEPTDEFLKVYEIVLEANNLALEADADGVLAENVDKAARDFITSKGFGQYFTHRTGHGLGLEIHEHPYIVKGNKEPLKSFNVHTIEPGIYLPKKFGVRIEDDVVVKKKGAKKIFNVKRHPWEYI